MLQHATYYHNTQADQLTICLEDYLGGVAIWGAIPAVFDTTHQGFDAGIHVHARLANSPKKIIDKTFSAVLVKYEQKTYPICEQSAIAFAMTSMLGITPIALSCDTCDAWILDTNLAAVSPSHHHYCSHCHEVTKTQMPCVANPLIALKTALNDTISIREVQSAHRDIVLDATDYAGGIQLWGSNSSIIWTSNRLEESGIHVHAYNNRQKRVIDNTYSTVVINNETISAEMLRILQVQLAIPAIKKHLGTLACPVCHTMLSHLGKNAVQPSQNQTCDSCNHQWRSNWMISNPVYHQLKQFNQRGFLRENNL